MGGWGNARALRVPEPLGPSGLPPAGGCVSGVASLPSPLGMLLPARTCPSQFFDFGWPAFPSSCLLCRCISCWCPQGSAGRCWLRYPGHGSQVWGALQRRLHPGLGKPRGAGCGAAGALLEDTLPRVLCLCSRGRKGFPVDMHSLSKNKPPSFIANVKEKSTFS